MSTNNNVKMEKWSGEGKVNYGVWRSKMLYFLFVDLVKPEFERIEKDVKNPGFKLNHDQINSITLFINTPIYDWLKRMCKDDVDKAQRGLLCLTELDSYFKVIFHMDFKDVAKASNMGVEENAAAILKYLDTKYLKRDEHFLYHQFLSYVKKSIGETEPII